MLNLDDLKEFWNPAVERCGIILRDGTIKELPNTHENPADDFAFDRSYFTENPDCVATWHTHPRTGPNLTVADYHSFKSMPELFHYIVSDGIVWGFYVQDGKVFLYDDSSV